MRFLVAAAALAATTAFATPAFAQSTDTIRAEALLIQPATLQGIQDLSFGMIVATPTAAGDVSIDPNSGARTLPTGMTGGTDNGQRGLFLGNGDVSRPVQITAVFPTRLSNTADRTRIVEFTGILDTAARTNTVTTGDTGVFYVGVGGTITIDAGQMPGLYDGEITVTANFQ